jgi:very-short-patch-repair endonuclease
MAPRPYVPPELKRRPFSLQEARAAGISRTALRGKSWRRLGTKLYCWVGLHENPWELLVAWERLLPSDAAFAGATAAWLHGLDVDPIHPIEAIVPSASGLRSRVGLSVRHCHLPRSDVVQVRRLRATTVRRTLNDLCHRLPAVDALVAIDAAIRAGLTDRNSLMPYRRLRSLAELAAPAESPMETRLRWLLIQAGLPGPEVQTELRDADGRFVGRADLYYPAARLAIEYDGVNHRDRLVEDDRRQNLLINAGFRLLRFTAADIHQRPDVIAAQVRQALRS